MGPSDPWPGLPRHLHPRRGAQRADPPSDVLRAEGGDPAARRLAFGGTRPAGLGQPVGARSPRSEHRDGDPGAARGRGRAARPPPTRDHRELDDGSARASARHAGRARRRRRGTVDRRLRHRVFVARLPAAPAGARAQDRPVVRDARHDEQRRCRDRAIDDRSGPQPGALDRGRGRRGRGRDDVPHRRRLRHRAGLLHRQADARRRRPVLGARLGVAHAGRSPSDPISSERAPVPWAWSDRSARPGPSSRTRRASGCSDPSRWTAWPSAPRRPRPRSCPAARAPRRTSCR